jgi:aryl carrier-like protein
MVPEAFVLLDALPLTANGKLDRKALPTPHAAPVAAPFVAPRSGTEAVLAQLWAELLQVERIGVHDDFFDLGGKSLVAMRMIGRLREAFGVDVPLRNLFEHPTVAGLAGVIDALSWAGAASRPAVADGREELAL